MINKRITYGQIPLINLFSGLLNEFRNYVFFLASLKVLGIVASGHNIYIYIYMKGMSNHQYSIR